MKYAHRLSFIIVIIVSSLVMGADVPDKLTYQDLVDHPERWPATVTMIANVRNSKGQSVRKGEKLGVIEVVAKGVYVDSGRGYPFGVLERQCDIVDSANDAWSKYTPAQRAINADAVAKDASLWPDIVHNKRTSRIDTQAGLTDRTVPAGTACTLAWFDQQGVYMRPNAFNPDEEGHVNASIEFTDMLEGARQRAAVDPDKRTSRYIEAVRNLMVDASGKPYTNPKLDQTKVFVFYFGAQWCQWCHQLSPDLVKFVNDHGAENSHMTFIMLDGDDQESEMYKYMNDDKLPWPAIKKKDWQKVPLFVAVRRIDWPQFLIVDKWGKVIYNEAGGGPSDLELHREALKKLNESGAAR